MLRHLSIALIATLILGDASEAFAQGGRGGNQRSGAGSQRLGSSQSRRSVRQKRSSGRSNRKPDKSAMNALRGMLSRRPSKIASTATPVLGSPGRRAASAFDLVEDGQIQDWFRTCDQNANGWLGYRETEESLRFDRPRFRVFDPDRDGRLTYEEFSDYYLYQIGNTGTFRPPNTTLDFSSPTPRTSYQLRIVFDRDGDRALDLNELQLLLESYERPDLSAAKVLKDLDTNENRTLEDDETSPLPNIVFQIALNVEEVPLDERAGTIDELFGELIESTGVRAPRLLGPVTSFRRLDQDNDGEISVKDLETLLRPSYSALRPGMVLNTLDLNDDGVLDRSELRAAFTDPK